MTTCRLRGGAIAALVLAAAGCPAPRPGVPDGGVDDDAGPGVVQFLPQLVHASDLDGLKGAQGDTKFLAQMDGAPVTAPILDACEFQNTKLYSFHLPFLNAQPGGEQLTFDEYVAMVIKRATRVWWGGEVIFLPSTEHPITHAPGVLAWTLYTEDSNGNRLTLDDIRQGNARLIPCTPGFANQLAFTPSSDEQVTTARGGQAQLASEGIAVVLP